MNKLKLLMMAKFFGSDVKGVRPFVLSKTEQPEEKFLKMDRGTNILCCPFESFSVETEGDFSMGSVKRGDFQILFDCVICHEVCPGEYRFEVLASDKVKGPHALYVSKNSIKMKFIDGREHAQDNLDSINLYYVLLNLIRDKLEIINAKKSGLVNTNQSVKYKSATGKRTEYKPRSYVYVSHLNRTSKKTDTAHSARVRWLEAWEVRAHWRKLTNPETLGKDRAGNRTVKGYTYVSECVKGKDKNEAAFKVRKVS